MTPHTANRRTLLVIDDQEENLQVLGTILNLIGYDLIPAFSATQALQRLQARLPDLILLDIVLPDMDGVALCREIKKNPAWAGIPIIFVSASDDKNLIVRALETGGVDYVTKPYNKAELISRVRTHLAIKESRDAVTAMAADKEALLGMLAHDFKNYLSGITVSARLLTKRCNGDDPRTTELLAEIVRSSDHMLTFTQRFLANQAAASNPLSPVSFDAASVITQVLRTHLEPAKAKRISIHSELPESALAAVGDANAFRQVLDNLVSNGVKFTPPGGMVSLRTGAEADHLTFEVEDNGPGFQEADYPLIFTRYSKLSAAPTRSEPSTGLGLSIARELMARMGGKLELTSKPGQSARFLLTLPRPPEPALTS